MAFANPFALAWAILLGVLVWLYLWEQRRPRVTVPSLLLWEEVREERRAASRLRVDPLFLLRFLILSLLVFGLAKPYWSRPAAIGGTRHLLVLDTTASMQAREGDTTRFEVARREALQFLEGLASDDEAMLVAAGRTPSVVVEWSRDRGRLREALEGLEALDVGGDLGVAVAFADGIRKRGEVPGELWVFSDAVPSSLPAGLRERVHLLRNGRSDQNVALESLEISQGRFQSPGEASAQVQLRNFSSRDVQGLVTVQVDEDVVARHGVTLGAGETKRIQTHGFPHAGRVVARFEPADALPLDNVAWGWIRPGRSLRVVLVSKPTSLVSDLRSLAPAAQLRLTVLSPEAWSDAAAEGVDLVLFHRWVPPRAPRVNALYLYPGEGNPLFPYRGRATNLEILDWNAEHAALRATPPFLDTPLRKVSVLEPPAGSEVLMRSRTADGDVALAFAMTEQNRRAICLSFDLESEHLLRGANPSLLLLLLGVLDWLGPSHEEAIVARAGEAVDLDLGAEGELREPNGRTRHLDANAMFEPLRAGVYEARSEPRSRNLLVNFANPGESDIGRAPEAAGSPNPQEPVAAAVAASATSPSFQFWPWLVAATLLLAEWWLAGRQGTASVHRTGLDSKMGGA